MSWFDDDHTDNPDQDPVAFADVHLALNGQRIAMDHGFLLYQELKRALPWLEDESLLGVHPVQGADNGAGELMLGHRARLVIRCPTHRQDELLTRLEGHTLHVGQHDLTVGAGKIKPLSHYSPLYAHCVVTGDTDETAFSQHIMRRLRAMNIDSRFICGKPQQIFDGNQIARGYSLLLHNLPLEHAFILQQQGIGLHRKLGCGIFIPHKSITAVGSIGSG